MSPESNDVLEIQQQAILETKVAGPITVGQIVAEVAENYDFSGHKPEHLHPLPPRLRNNKVHILGRTRTLSSKNL